MALQLDTKTSPNRVYLRGDTYGIRDRIKAKGGRWDVEQKAWWMGIVKLAEAQALMTAGPTATPATPSQGMTPDTEVLGRAAYKGRPYLLLWTGDTGRVKLAFNDGSVVFWADAAMVTIEKSYQKPLTLAELQRLRTEYKQARKEGREPCGKCGSFACGGTGGCYMCGCNRCDGAHGGLCEDD